MSVASLFKLENKLSVTSVAAWSFYKNKRARSSSRTKAERQMRRRYLFYISFATSRPPPTGTLNLAFAPGLAVLLFLISLPNPSMSPIPILSFGYLSEKFKYD